MDTKKQILTIVKCINLYCDEKNDVWASGLLRTIAGELKDPEVYDALCMRGQVLAAPYVADPITRIGIIEELQFFVNFAEMLNSRSDSIEAQEHYQECIRRSMDEIEALEWSLQK